MKRIVKVVALAMVLGVGFRMYAPLELEDMEKLHDIHSEQRDELNKEHDENIQQNEAERAHLKDRLALGEKNIVVTDPKGNHHIVRSSSDVDLHIDSLNAQVNADHDAQVKTLSRVQARQLDAADSAVSSLDDVLDMKDEKLTREEMEARVDENLAERANFRNLAALDRAGYKQQMRQKLDAMANDMSDALGIDRNSDQYHELRLALSDGLMGEPEMIISAGRLALAGAGADLAIAAAPLAGAIGGGLALRSGGDFSTPSLKGTDARAFDYRPTANRLADVVTREPFVSLERRLNLKQDQVDKLNDYRKKLESDPTLQHNKFVAEVKESLARKGYTALRVAIVVATIYVAVEIVKALVDGSNKSSQS